MFAVRNRGGVTQATAAELDRLWATLKAWITVEHNEDGTHVLPASATVAFSAASRLLGRGSANGAGASEEILLGTGLTLAGTTLNVSGGAVEVATVSVTGGQIAFPATQSASTGANTLDDYEEGTWTPTDGSGGSLSFTNVVAHYVKIGQLVMLWASIGWPNTANGANAILGGLPFTSQTVAQTIGAAVVMSDSGSAYGLIVDSNATTATFKTTTGLAAVTNATISNGSTRTLKVSLSYRAAA
jgi:hypothetical protein